LIIQLSTEHYYQELLTVGSPLGFGICCFSAKEKAQRLDGSESG